MNWELAKHSVFLVRGYDKPREEFLVAHWQAPEMPQVGDLLILPGKGNHAPVIGRSLGPGEMEIWVNLESVPNATDIFAEMQAISSTWNTFSHGR